MRLNYHAYYLKNIDSGVRVTFDLRDFLKAFCALQSPVIRSAVEYNGETLYLMNDIENVFLLVQTRANEIIRKIDTQNLTLDDIDALLNDHEQVGFASYLYFGDGFFGLASTVLAPRLGAIDALISKLFQILGITDWRLVTHPLVHDIAAGNVKDLNFVAGTSIEVSAALGVGQDILGVLGIHQDEFQLIDGFEIKVKPRRNRSIKEPISRFAENRVQDVDRMVLRAKQEAGDFMTDLYLNESGAIFDTINKGNGRDIPAKMVDKVLRNELIVQKVEEIRESHELHAHPVGAIDRFNTVDNWPDNLDNL